MIKTLFRLDKPRMEELLPPHDPPSRPEIKCNIEPIAVIEDWHLSYHKGNALHCLAKSGQEDPEQEVMDLEKAVWHLNREIHQAKSRQLAAKVDELGQPANPAGPA